LINAGIDLVLVSHIHTDADRRSGVCQCVRGTSRRIEAQVSDGHAAVCLEVALSDPMIDAADAASNEGDFAFEFHEGSYSIGPSAVPMALRGSLADEHWH
jgi:hypothetical protein